GSSVESGFEPGTLRSEGRVLTTRPPRLRNPLGIGIESCSSDRSESCKTGFDSGGGYHFTRVTIRRLFILGVFLDYFYLKVYRDQILGQTSS
ncbi:hypothetical protein AVEN_60758-1, partial [Araneus ventricosus]